MGSSVSSCPTGVSGPDNWLRLPFLDSLQYQQTGGVGYAGDLLTLSVGYSVGNCVSWSSISNCAMTFALLSAEANSSLAASPAWLVASGSGAYRSVATLGSANQNADFSESRTFELPVSSSAAGLYVAFRAQSVHSHSTLLYSIDLFQYIDPKC